MTTPAPAGRLPSVLARLSFADPLGEAYQPQSVTFDESGRAYALCYHQGQLNDGPSALVPLDLRVGMRGRALALPGLVVGPVIVFQGRTYSLYQDGEFQTHLAAADLADGRVLAKTPAGNAVLNAGLAVGQGRLYLLTPERLEVRDPSTLGILETLSLVETRGLRRLLYDRDNDRLFVASGDSLYAYRGRTLQRLWREEGLGANVRQMLLDIGAQRLWVQTEPFANGAAQARLLAFDAATGSLQGEPANVPNAMWQLAGTDAAGRLLFSEMAGAGTRLWLASADLKPLGPEAALLVYAPAFVSPQGEILAAETLRHRIAVFDGDLKPLGTVATGHELMNLVADPGADRAYANDSEGRLHIIDTAANARLTSIVAGAGALALDEANGLLFVGREPEGSEVAVVDTVALTVTAVITGGNAVAVDSAGRRAFVGSAPRGPQEDPGQVQVWDTHTFRRIGTIAPGGAPAYNPLRDEIYLQSYSAPVIDGRTYALKGDLLPDVAAQTLRWCNGCAIAGPIAVSGEHDVVAVGQTILSAGKGAGPMPPPRTFSARTLAPVTHTATILTLPDGGPPLILPPEEGWVYEQQRYARYVVMNSALAYPVGSTEPQEERDGLSLDLYLPGSRVILSLLHPAIWAFDARTWEPLGWIPHEPIRAMDPQRRRLYAWKGADLTILGFEGAPPLAPEPSRPWQGEILPGAVRQIALSPGFARDRTVFAVAGPHLLRSTDAARSWQELRGLPPVPSYSVPNYTLALSPEYERDRTVFAGGHVNGLLGLGVWRSQDGGETWSPMWRGLTALLVERLAISPRYRQDHELAAYARYHRFWKGESGWALLRSADGAEHWELAATQPYAGGTRPLPEPESLWPSRDDPLQFRVANYGEALERSTDGGLSWQTVLRTGSAGTLSVVRGPGAQEAYALGPLSLFRSLDGGATWEQAQETRLQRLPGIGPDFTALAVGTLEGHTMLFVGDWSGRLDVLNAEHLSWAVPAAAPTATPPPHTCYEGERLSGPASARLGCPTGPVVEAPMAWQAFEHGWMVWRGDEPQVYVLEAGADGSRWRSFVDTWREGDAEAAVTLSAPANLQQPVRGFGKVWREQLGSAASTLGWATGSEQGYPGRWQPFEGGLLITGPDGLIYAILNDGTWASR
ncbi:MAG: hypothetical protein ACUVX9_12435 [Anaerolineae bacterium]